MSYLKMLVVFIVSVGTFVSVACAEDVQPQRAKDDFVSRWVVSIDSGTLVLTIASVTKKSDSLFGLDASFGFIGTPPKPVDAEVEYGAETRQLKFTTASGIRYHLVLKPDGAHSGTYVGPRGSGNVLSFEKVAEVDLQSTIALGTKMPEVVAPEPGVPSECSAFSGRWNGNWNGDASLWITSVDQACAATYVYAKKGWRTKGSAKIQNQRITFQAANATFEFSNSGLQLRATYRPNDTTSPVLAAEFARE